MQRHATPPGGPRARGHPRSASEGSRGPSRGGIQKRRAANSTDRDGDLDMDSSARAAGRARGGRGRGDNSRQTNGHNQSGRGRTVMNSAAPRGIFGGASLQKAIAQGIASGDATFKGPRSGVGMEGVLKEASRKGRLADRGSELDQIRVRGLKQSKAAANPDGGVKDLLSFLERKATGSEPSARNSVRIRKSRPDGDALIVYVRTEDTPNILRLNTYSFAGTPLAIELLKSDSIADSITSAEPSEETKSTRDKLAAVLTRRYNPELKLLDLSALGKDPDLISLGTFAQDSTTSKFFPALMLICDSLFTDPQQKRDAVISVSLADNELKSVKIVTTLAQTFPDLKNLDLSNNKFETMGALGAWRWRFRGLQHLVLTGTPLEKVDPNYKDEVLRWYPTLLVLNTVQVRSEEEVASIGKLPLPIKGASFQDEGQIAEDFVRQFFPAYDSDRTALVNGFYDDGSSFSYSINTSAPRAAQKPGQVGNDEMKPLTWDAYIKGSRNLVKINHLAAQISRAHVGLDSIRQRWTSLPATRHPSLIDKGQKWLVECHPVPGLPDPTGQSAAGVGGLMVMVHGEFDEMNVATGQATAKRSFDRTFILGPGGATGIRVISDVMTYRAYGGHEAWVPEEVDLAANGPAVAASIPQVPIPEGFGVAVEGKPPDQVSKEQMVLEMSTRTKMTLPYSQLCLEEKMFDFDAALLAFEAVKGNLPADAFMA